MAFHSSSVVILLLVAFVALPHLNNASFLSDACGKAADFDANINRDFCVKSLQSDPKSALANLHGLVQITMNLAIKNVMRAISHINYLLSKPAYAHLKRDLTFCQEMYTDARSELFDAVKSINASNCGALDNISAAMTSMDTCKDECTDASFVDKQYADGNQLCAMLLNFLNKDVFH